MLGIPAAEAALLTSSLMVAWAIGGPVFGWLSDRLQNRKGLYLGGCALAVAGWMTIILLPGLSLPLMTLTILATGFSSGCMILSFAFAKESVPRELAGTISGVINMGVMSGPMILQPAVGHLLDRLWTGEMADGIRLYTAESYRQGFALMLAWIILSLLLLLFTKETGCRQQA